jgi:hypothetical protein
MMLANFAMLIVLRPRWAPRLPPISLTGRYCSNRGARKSIASSWLPEAGPISIAYVKLRSAGIVNGY